MKQVSSRMILISAFLLICFACGGEDIQSFLNYLRDPANGLVQASNKSGSNYTMEYYPTDLMVYKEVNIGENKANKIRQELGDLEYFRLRIEHDVTPTKEGDFYYAYQFERDLFQIVEGDTIRPSLYLLEQGLGGSSKLNINLAFLPSSDNLAIYCQDKYGFTTVFNFDRDDISNIPNLRI